MANHRLHALPPALGLAALAAVAPACTGAPAEVGDARPPAPPRETASPGAPVPPRTLYETGLYADRDGTTLADGVLTFSPQYPLWTDGAAKRRFIHLPPGQAIDASDPDAWRFPVGTRIWKEFSLGRRVETRFMELGPGGWLYATYVWSDDGREAVLADARGVELAIEGRATPHSIPSHADCIACHDNAGTPVLGFSLLQLSPDRDPLAPHASPPDVRDVDLADLVERGLLRGLPASIHSSPPRIAARTPTERAALGYLHGNCGGCHRGEGTLARLGMRLAHEHGARIEPARATTIGVASRFALPSDPDAPARRVVAGRPESSVLLARIATRDPFAQMPPLGTHVVDEEAVRLVSAWIAELDPGAPL